MIANIATFSPIIILAVTSLLLALVVGWKRHHAATAGISAAGSALAGLSLVFSWHHPSALGGLVTIDSYAILFMGLILLANVVLVFLSFEYLKQRLPGKSDEFYIMLLLATLGALVLVASSHFASFFLSLELLSVSLYVMIYYLQRQQRALEAAIKYLILAAASSAFLLFGMALIYAEMGTLQFQDMASKLAQGKEWNLFFLAGMAWFLVGIGFKLALAPFHMWTPDVYQDAPAPVTAYIATISKGAVVALLLRYLAATGGQNSQILFIVLSFLAILSMFVGNLLALWQNNLKRLLAYSSIAHLGYVLVALVAGGTNAAQAVVFYMIGYCVAILGAFAIISGLTQQEQEREQLEEYRGLLTTDPWRAIVLSVALLSLAGIPLTAGFMGKYFVLAVGIQASLWGLVAMLVLNSAIALYYYLRVIVVMISPVNGEPIEVKSSMLHQVLLAGILLLLLGLGIVPSPVLEMIRTSIVAIF